MIEFSRHAFSSYDADVQSLLSELTDMSHQVEQLLSLLAAAIHEGAAHAKQAKDMDKAVNKMEYDVIARLHSVLGKYTPSVDELRLLISTIRISAALERIGDIAKANVRRLEHFYTSGSQVPQALRQPTLDMLDILRGMLRAAMQNLVAFDTEQLGKILAQDDKLDGIYIALMAQIQQEQGMVAQTMFILAKDVERAADHSFEMGRIAYYAHTGEKPKKKQLRKA